MAAWMRILGIDTTYRLTVMLACLIAGPASAMSINLNWQLDIDSANGDPLVGERTIMFDPPDPAVWQLTSASLSSIFVGSGYYYGLYDPDPGYGGPLNFWARLLDSNGSQLLLAHATFAGYCEPYVATPICGDYDQILVESVWLDDPALDGPLTIRYEFDKSQLWAEPLSESYRAGMTGTLILDYAPVPEPSTALLVMTGLLAIAYRQRRHGRAAPG